MTPLAERWEAAIEAEFIDDDDDLDVEFDFNILLRGDMAARGTYYHQGIGDGWLTRNEARAREGLDPLDGLDEPLQPLNMIEAGEEPPTPSEPKKLPPPAETPNEDESANARLAALADAAADRIARKELLMVKQALATKADGHGALIEAYGKHAVFLQRALNVGASAALGHCEMQRDWLLADSAIEESSFLATTHLKLMQLALKGKL